MDPTKEIRTIPVGTIHELINILDMAESWKKLMSHIPKELESKDFIPKYGSEHINLIEIASTKQKRPCTVILFEEWGTSGRVRPTVGSLLQILIKAELFRAAEFVAVNLLKIAPPRRPLTGPAANINVSLPHILAERELQNVDITSLLNNMSYPNLTSNNPDTFDQNIEPKNIPENLENRNFLVIPSTNNNNSGPESSEKRNFLAIPSTSKNSSGTSLNTNPSANTNITHVSSEVSNMIQFSNSQINNNTEYINESVAIPAISMLLNEGNSSSSQQNLSINNYSEVNFNNNDNAPSNSISNVSIEAINMNVTNVSMSASGFNIPDFDAIQSKSELIIPDISILQGDSSQTISSNSEFNMPELSALQNHSTSLPITSASLNTILPHFSYKELQNVTNNFNENNNDDQVLPRVIGAGGFGTVYLTETLLNRPVAVKKIHLFCPAGQNCESIISKQFKTEVEILSKYNHDNILSLLGYSCDGPNYCVIYEYIDGGSLQENIASNKNLSPDIRESIILKSAKGIEYLHNGFPTPLIHRDIKSANILVTKSNIPKICDFGLVRLLPKQTVTSNVMGTSAYMAPEAQRGDVSVKMDVFSFGVVILEILTSLPPMDYTRSGADIFTHVQEMCSEGSVQPLLDKSIGRWDNAEVLFSLAMCCLQDKIRRPLISDIVEKLRNL